MLFNIRRFEPITNVNKALKGVMALVDSVNSTGESSVTQNSAARKAAVNSTFDREAFLKILVTQLANQDPLEPLDQAEFISQMAQFASVEQIANIKEQLEDLSQFFRFSAASLVGQKVTYADVETGEEKEGTVAAVTFEPDEVSLKLQEGSNVPIERLISIG